MLRGADGKTFRRQKRIILRIEEERRNTNRREIREGAGFGPVIRGVAETVQGRGIAVVEFLKCADVSDTPKVEFLGIAQGLGFDLGDERFQKAPEINTIRQKAVELDGAGGEVHGSTNRSSGDDARMGWRLAEVFEDHISTQAEADERDLRPRLRRVRDDRGEIGGVAAMIEALEPIEFATATSEIPGECIPSGGVERGGHAADVARIGAAFEAMRDDCQASVAGARPVQVEKISVSQFELLPRQGEPDAARQQNREDCLHVPVAKPERRLKA